MICWIAVVCSDDETITFNTKVYHIIGHGYRISISIQHLYGDKREVGTISRNDLAVGSKAKADWGAGSFDFAHEDFFTTFAGDGLQGTDLIGNAPPNL